MSVDESAIALWDDGARFDNSCSEDSSEGSESGSVEKKSKTKSKNKRDGKKKSKKDEKSKSKRKPRKSTAVTLSSKYTTWKKTPAGFWETTHLLGIVTILLCTGRGDFVSC